MLVTCLKGTWMIEQPASSRLVWYPRWEKFLASSWMRVWRVGWWSRHYGALSPMLVFQFEGQSFPETCIFKIFFTVWFLQINMFLCFRKRHRAWSNTKEIHVLDRGSLRRAAREKCTLQTTKKVRKAGGKVMFQGIKGALKSTQCESQWIKKHGKHQRSH